MRFPQYRLQIFEVHARSAPHSVVFWRGGLCSQTACGLRHARAWASADLGSSALSRSSERVIVLLACAAQPALFQPFLHAHTAELHRFYVIVVSHHKLKLVDSLNSQGVGAQVLSAGGDVGADQVEDTTAVTRARAQADFLPVALVLGLTPGAPCNDLATEDITGTRCQD